MAYNILGIHPHHNGSTCVISDGKLIFYLEEERLSKVKRDDNKGLVIKDIIEKYNINEIALAGYSSDSQLQCQDKDTFQVSFNELGIQMGNISYEFFNYVNHKFPNIKITSLGHDHHLTHAAGAFYNSGFNKAISIVVDGSGTYKKIKIQNEYYRGMETESIWECEYPNTFKLKYQVFGENRQQVEKNLQQRIISKKFDIGNFVTITKAYEGVNWYLGFESLDGGKTMGVSSYGKPNPLIPTLFKDNRASKDIFIPGYPYGSYIDEHTNPQFTRNKDPKEWHKDFSKISEIETDLAWKIQQETQEKVGDLIEKSLSLSSTKNIVLSGGYILNCVANYYLKKRFPEINFYIEPIAYDGGTSIGAAKLAWARKQHQNIQDPLKTLYWGPQYSTNEYLQTLKKYTTKFTQLKTTPKQIAKLISERNIVTIFQGRSEAGPRALGNRSILYDPTDPNGKDFVNKVKNREWFRPFAGTVLLEKANEWFDMAGLEESPFMMYAMDVWPDKQEQIKAITHVDGTCRIQTVTEEQNKNYYKLIQEFEKITGVPILFNTSFNLAGDPLVETIEDALETMLKSEMKYMYVPELDLLLEKNK